MKVYVKTPSRLHFALIDLEGSLGRVDGGVGLAINHPNMILEASPNKNLRIEGFKIGDIKRYAKRFFRYFRISGGAKINVTHFIPSHVGLGAATQLSLAVASALAKIYGVEEDILKLGEAMGRGGTSGIGVACFLSGGLIVDGGHLFKKRWGKRSFLPSSVSKAPPPPILLRCDFPEDWFFVITLPYLTKGLHGKAEVKVFRERCPIPSSEVGKVCRLILMKMLPALMENDINEFGQSLTLLQNAGFAAYTQDLMNPTIKDCIEVMLENGAFGAGQSSFGPNAFGLVKGIGEAERLSSLIRKFLEEREGGEVFYTSSNNCGALIKIIQD